MKQRVLFIDRDGTLVIEPPVDYQLDALEKLEFYPKVMRNLGFIRSKLDFKFVMVTNQDGLGTPSFPEETFWPAHNLMMKTLAGEGVTFDEICIDRSMPEDNAPTRKPRTGMLQKYLEESTYDLAHSFVIGDRATDVELAKNLGCRAILLQEDKSLLAGDKMLEEVCVLATKDWDRVAEFLFAGERRAEVRRTTKETDIHIALNLDGNGQCCIHTGLGFFDHMLEQIGKHGGMDLEIAVKGDLEVDEHHTIEDTALALGIGQQAGHGALWLCRDDGRLPLPSLPGFWRTALAGLGSRIPPREDRRNAYGDVPAFLQILQRCRPHEPARPCGGSERAPQDRRHLQGIGPCD